VLKSVAATLQASLRKADLVGRLGGDEFAVLLPETTAAGAQRVFETLRQTLLKRVSEQGWPIGFSIGVAFFQEAPASVEEAIKFADALMYRVKKGGKNRLVFDIYAGPSDGNRPGGTEHPQPPRSASPDARFP
jgi:diguanylate cyclase (GGDEF)-like protein